MNNSTKHLLFIAAQIIVILMMLAYVIAAVTGN